MASLFCARLDSLMVGCIGVLLAGCSNGTTATSRTIDVPSPVASSATPETAASASPVSFASVTIPADWAFGDPKLTELLRVQPICGTTESIFAGKNTSRSYEVYVPGVAQADLEKHFRAAAKKIGYSVGPILGGADGFLDESNQLYATITDSHILVTKVGPSPPRVILEKIDRAGFELAPLVQDLLEQSADYHIRFERVGDVLSLELELPAEAKAKEKVVDWAKSRHLEADKDGWWIRKRRPDAPRGIAIDVNGKALWISENLGNESACFTHTSRESKHEVTPAPSHGKPSNRPLDKEEEDLFKEMLGP